MLLREHGPRPLDVVLAVAAFAAIGVGFALFNLCGGGDSLVCFGVGVALLGAALFRSGAWATIVPISIAAFTLIAAGWYGATVAGCYL